MVLGGNGHKTLEKNFSQKIKSGKDLPLTELTDHFSDLWKSEKYNIVFSEDELAGSSPAKTLGKFKDRGIASIETFYNPTTLPVKSQKPKPAKINAIKRDLWHGIGTINPIASEERFDIVFEGHNPQLMGFIDRIDSGNEIAEVKFTAKTPPAGDANRDMQLSIYDLAHRVKYGRPPSLLKKQWIVAGKKVVEQTAPPRDDETMERLMSKIELAMRAIKTGVFVPATPGSWQCSRKWCGYWSQCLYKS